MTVKDLWETSKTILFNADTNETIYSRAMIEGIEEQHVMELWPEDGKIAFTTYERN